MGRVVLENNDWILKDASRYDLSSDLIDLTDGSWTLEDPDSLLDSVSYSSGYNTVTWNTIRGLSAQHTVLLDGTNY
jgi:hypothetical protein